MRYLADILTLLRIELGLALLGMAVVGGAPEMAFVVFVVAELTDAFDGTCAKKWPFARGKEPKYRKYAAKYDMLADILVVGALLLFVVLRVNMVVGLILGGYLVLSAILGDLVVYGKILGHPDDCRKKSLMRQNFDLAKKVILARRYLYVICLVVLGLMVLFATSWPNIVKYGVMVFLILVLEFMWYFLRQRRKNISRDAVDIERKMSKK